MQKKNILPNSFHISGMVRKILLSWLMAVVIGYILLPVGLRDLSKLEGLAQMSMLQVVLLTCGISAMLLYFSRFVRLERWGVVGVFGALMLAVLCSCFTWALLVLCLLILVVLVVYAVFGWDSRPEPVFEPKKSKKVWAWLTVGLTVTFLLFVSAWTVGRIYGFRTPTYDFGIFSQMFYHMKESGMPMTTLERDGMLSHFAVHVSPIYYLMLPIYWLFPSPITLQVLQGAVLASAVLPLWKLGKHHGLPGAGRLLLCLVLLLYPAFSGGVSYDLHENCFLTPLLLWLFYGIDRRNTALTTAAALLTLMVKEDAAVYVAVIGLWLMIKTLLRFRKSDTWSLVAGIALLTVAMGWFLLVIGYLDRYGDGVMTNRYKNFMYDNSASLVTVVKAVILNPMKGFYECVDPEKWCFIARTMLPLLGVPLLTRRYERYLLLVPYLLVNLMSDYQYQHDIFFQYTFGSTAFLLYLTVVNLANLKKSWLRLVALGLAATVGAVYFGMEVVPKAMEYPMQAVSDYDHYQKIRDTLDTIPEEASVAACTFYTTHLSQREILYDIRYCSEDHLLEAEYVVLNDYGSRDYKNYATGGKNNGYQNLVELLEQHGYKPYAAMESVLVVYKK